MPKLRSRASSQPGRVAAQRLDRVHGLAAALDLADGEVVGVGAVDAGEVHEVHVRELARVVHRAPGAGDGGEVGRDAARRRSPARTACAGRARTSSSSLPVVSMSHSPLPPQSRVGLRVGGARRRGTRRLSTPARWNITEAAISCSRGVRWVGAPARWATSASPVASMTRRAEDRLAARPSTR